jgi:hypothetical protein
MPLTSHPSADRVNTTNSASWFRTWRPRCQLKALGVVFETFEIAGDRWSGEIAENEYRRVAWFRDSEGNLLNVAQRLDGKSISRKR